ncbi:hypothetical protein CPB83DRAFT_125500 [Crepidotus variabilis]|uniref:Uncharacterized protein n=1 Tax=Crepidotus variabilis TaxID=179855 RepID=A0A9P6JSV0_9AGAR|nr:hypothetical protein CPB83DRAFT_125500 [Crepidotus variabilis]
MTHSLISILCVLEVDEAMRSPKVRLNNQAMDRPSDSDVREASSRSWMNTHVVPSDEAENRYISEQMLVQGLGR